jgi:hypothetical protein
MKRIFFAFVLILLTANMASAQEKAAVISVDSAVYDFGNIKEAAGPVTHVFKVKNNGEIALAIKDVKASCSCTVPNWTKEPIAPGKTGEITVTYNPAKHAGPFIRNISVYSNGSAGSFILTIKGNVN